MCFSASHSSRCHPTLPSQPTSNPTKNEVIVHSMELNRPDCEQRTSPDVICSSHGVMNQGKACAEINSIIIQIRLLICFNFPENHGYMATVKQAAIQKVSAPATTPWTAAFKGAKTTKHGLINKYDVMPSGRMQVDDVIHDMSLNLSLDHVTNRSNDQYGELRLPTWRSTVAANTSALVLHVTICNQCEGSSRQND